MSYGSHDSGSHDDSWGKPGGSYSAQSGFGQADPWGRPPARRSRSIGLLVFLGGAGAAVVFLCCGGFISLAVFGLNMVTDQVADDLRDNPVVVEHIGTIEEFEMDWGESFSHEDDDVYVYHIKGPEGQGKVYVTSISVDDSTEEVVWGYLELSTGETHDLFPDEPANAGESDHFEEEW
jgi:hypothetical protein